MIQLVVFWILFAIVAVALFYVVRDGKDIWLRYRQLRHAQAEADRYYKALRTIDRELRVVARTSCAIDTPAIEAIIDRLNAQVPERGEQ